jgi:hypothetical protein
LKRFICILILTFLNTCITIALQKSFQAADKLRNISNDAVLKNCNIDTYLKCNSEYYESKASGGIYLISWVEGFLGLYGIYYFNPEGIKMVASFLYGSGAFSQKVKGKSMISSFRKKHYTKIESIPDKQTGKKNPKARVLLGEWNGEGILSECKNKEEFFALGHEFFIEINDLGMNKLDQETICKANFLSETVLLKNFSELYSNKEGFEDRLNVEKLKLFFKKEGIIFENYLYHYELIHFAKELHCYTESYFLFSVGEEEFDKKLFKFLSEVKK